MKIKQYTDRTDKFKRMILLFGKTRGFAICIGMQPPYRFYGLRRTPYGTCFGLGRWANFVYVNGV